MSATVVPHAVIAAREAHSALLDLKNLVEDAARKIETAQREAIGLAIASTRDDGPLSTLRAAVESLRSSAIESAVAEVRTKAERILLAIG